MARDDGPPPEDEGDPFSDGPEPPPPAVAPAAASKPPKSRAGPEDLEGEAHDDDVERALIGALLLGPVEAARECLQIAPPEAVYRDAHRDIVAAVAEVVERGDDPDLPLVTAALKQRRKLAGCGGVPYLADCMEAPSTWKNGPRYARIVAAHHLRRALAEAADRIGKLARDNGKGPAELMAEAVAAVKAIPVPERHAPIIFGDALSEMIGEPEWLWQDWLPRGFLTVLAADPGMGKSALALWIAANLGSAGRWPDGLPMVAATKTLWLDAEAMQGENLKRLRVWGFDRGCVGWAGEDGMEAIDLRRSGAFRAYVHSAKATDCGLVVLDSLSQSAGGDERAEVLEPILTEGILAARDLGLAVLVIHHLRKARQDEPSKVALDRLRGSSVIGQVARAVWGMWLPDKSSATARVEVIKSNLGPIGAAFGMLWSEGQLKFGEAPEEAEKAPATIRGQAADMILAALASGPMTTDALIAEANRLRITHRTFYNARGDLLDREQIVEVVDYSEQRPRKVWALATAGGRP